MNRTYKSVGYLDFVSRDTNEMRDRLRYRIDGWVMPRTLEVLERLIYAQMQRRLFNEMSAID